MVKRGKSFHYLMHKSAMAAVVVKCQCRPPWCHPPHTNANSYQSRPFAVVPIRGGHLGSNGTSTVVVNGHLGWCLRQPSRLTNHYILQMYLWAVTPNEQFFSFVRWSGLDAQILLPLWWLPTRNTIHHSHLLVWLIRPYYRGQTSKWDSYLSPPFCKVPCPQTMVSVTPVA
jgi:hypothetical protein